METLAEKLMIGEAEFVVDKFFISVAKLELKLTSQGRVCIYTAKEGCSIIILL